MSRHHHHRTRYPITWTAVVLTLVAFGSWMTVHSVGTVLTALLWTLLALGGIGAAMDEHKRTARQDNPVTVVHVHVDGQTTTTEHPKSSA